MEKIKEGKIKMKPKWYFLLGSILMFLGLVLVTVLAILLVDLILFLFRKHYGPMYQYRLQFILLNFPWWLIIPSILTLILGVRLLKEYQFSYKNNFLLIIFGYVFIIIISAFLVNQLNLDSFFYQKRFFRKFYYQKELNKKHFKNGPFWLRK